MVDQGVAASRFGLESQGIVKFQTAHWNLAASVLYEHSLRRGEGRLAKDGPLVVSTVPHCGRSPNDKFIVDDPTTHETVWWGEVNAPMSEAHF